MGLRKEGSVDERFSDFKKQTNSFLRTLQDAVKQTMGAQRQRSKFNNARVQQKNVNKEMNKQKQQVMAAGG